MPPQRHYMSKDEEEFEQTVSGTTPDPFSAAFTDMLRSKRLQGLGRDAVDNAMVSLWSACCRRRVEGASFMPGSISPCAAARCMRTHMPTCPLLVLRMQVIEGDAAVAAWRRARGFASDAGGASTSAAGARPNFNGRQRFTFTRLHGDTFCCNENGYVHVSKVPACAIACTHSHAHVPSPPA